MHNQEKVCVQMLSLFQPAQVNIGNIVPKLIKLLASNGRPGYQASSSNGQASVQVNTQDFVVVIHTVYPGYQLQARIAFGFYTATAGP